MKMFLAIYLGSPMTPAMQNWQKLDEQTRKEKEKAGIAAWKAWVSQNGTSLVDVGSPVGKTKRIDAQGIADIRNQITGYTLVEAESHEAAAKLFLNHPHFSMFPGEGIEIMECLPIPESK